MIKGLSGTEFLTNTASAQYKAACWLLYDDPISLDEVEERLIQRYLVGTVYFALGMDSSDSVKSYMGEDLLELEECSWNDAIESTSFTGISCNDDGFVTSIHFGECIKDKQIFRFDPLIYLLVNN